MRGGFSSKMILNHQNHCLAIHLGGGGAPILDPWREKGPPTIRGTIKDGTVHKAAPIREGKVIPGTEKSCIELKQKYEDIYGVPHEKNWSVVNPKGASTWDRKSAEDYSGVEGQSRMMSWGGKFGPVSGKRRTNATFEGGRLSSAFMPKRTNHFDADYRR